MPETLEVIHIQPTAVVELKVSTAGIKTWTIKCRGNTDQEVLDRTVKMNADLQAIYGDPAHLSS